MPALASIAVKSGGQLLDRLPKRVDIDGFDQVQGKASLLASEQVVLLAVAADGDPFEAVLPRDVAHHVHAAPIGQAFLLQGQAG